MFPDIHNVQNKIRRKLLNQNWLNKMNIPTKIVEYELNSNKFRVKLNEMITNNDYSCKSTLQLCENILNNLVPLKPKNWLEYLYQYTLYKSFPDAVSITLHDELKVACELYLKLLRIVCDLEKKSYSNTWKSKYPLFFLTQIEENELEHPGEYKRFVRAFKHTYAYEMMKLSEEVFGYNTLDHITGVHYIALFLARQLKQLGIAVDLGRVSGAAAGHDIGKYGCKGTELKRVPHLHYYYTDQWFKKFNIHYIRNIAINHSTWDLELENLSLESLILIYCDFRVKNKNTEHGIEMNIFSLNDSFQVILDKLENVDEYKIKRYKKVYAKLKDFEDYLINIGIDVEINNIVPTEKFSKSKPYSLMHGKEVIKNLKYLSINHNIKLMYMLRNQYSLDKILESARSEYAWKNLREYIRVFEEYSTYLTQKQKLQTIKFLYDNLVHTEDDIRRHCAELIGKLIAYFDEDYRKEIPEDVKLEKPDKTSIDLFNEYLNLLIYPEPKIIPSHKIWIGYSTRIMIDSLFRNCRKNMTIHYRDVLIKYFVKYFSNETNVNKHTQLFLLEAVKYIPLDNYTENLEILFEYILKMLKKRNITLRLSALEVIYSILNNIPKESSFKQRLIQFFTESTNRSKLPVENMLKYEIAKSLNIDNITELFEHYCSLDNKKISEIFLTNLKSATNWIIKKNQIDLLLKYTINNSESRNILHTCIHFCNILKVSEIETVRNRAGKAILKLMPLLSFEERNEVAVELLRALEIEGQKFTEYIPKFLGKVLLWLKPKELDEIIDDLKIKIKTSNSDLKALILKTIGVSISHYDDYNGRFHEKPAYHERRLNSMFGILLNGLGNYKTKVKQSSIAVIGKEIFGSKYLTYEKKYYILKLISKKLLNLISSDDENELLFLANSAALTHIYRFISDYSFSNGNIDIESPKKIAFFPGTFDPFSLSHKEIAISIRNMGFEVYLAVDEFSWSKRTLPNLIRRKILNMSISDELGIYIFPEEYSINIANPNDLKNLRKLFKNSELYIVVGSDVVVNASSYKKNKEPNSIHTFPHIVFKRGNTKELDNAIKNIDNKVEFLTLPLKYSKISSSQIRNCIDEKRDISKLIDPLAEQYIYENGFYQKVPRNKLSMTSLWFHREIIELIDENNIQHIARELESFSSNFKNYITQLKEKDSARIFIIRNKLNNNEILGFSTFYWIRSNVLYKEIRDQKISNYIRNNTSGRLIFITGLYTKKNTKINNLEQILINETLSFCISKDYEYAIYKNMLGELTPKSIEEILTNQGFINIEGDSVNSNAFVVNMSSPCVINLDIKNVIKEPFISNSNVREIIDITRQKLISSISRLYPGELTLCFDSDILNQSLINMVCNENSVPTEVTVPRKLGDAMCVPYGDILDKYVVPNTVTKSLHTEKLFSPDINNFTIGEFPYYLNLENQIKIVKSFERPVILVDTILHKGYRIRAIAPIFHKNNIHIHKILIGILSGRGQDLMDKHNIDVDSVHFIPRLKIWFNESDMYPFIGGDALLRGKVPERNLIPSINTIMPYNYPAFIKNTSTKNIYNMSKVCLYNSLDILTTLESAFHQFYSRNLILSSMGRVFTTPRCPEHGKGIQYDLNMSPSFYLKNDIEFLNRLEHIIE
ncbi:nicotinate-nucleotide adenylyltransferase [Clostridium tepidiprofundi DSM 19306]|uniref:nicotinate-nucleotide adenylyltransferase n=1 Tax=Clostridium tepidiprofundi DSM 19306 TaxID=1121338 RepID=A0A151B582_9CLOT|nr:cytidyltransferase [Clostridium tepidiprofundi]KYH35046.1 nicotinate-nucleotide adenylyltransferase [Clostridium tepidiprofundi DSM 19306]